MEPPSKNKISNFGTISPYTQFYIPTLSSLSQFEKEKRKEKKRRERHLCSWTVYLLYILTTLKVYIIIVKDSCILMLPTWSKLLFVASAPNLLLHAFLFSFCLPYVILLKIVPINSFKNITRETGVADYYNIILLRLNQEVHIFHCLGEGKRPGGCVDSVNLEPLASGGQSSLKLIPHIICQFLYAWEKNSEQGLILQGIKCQPAPSSHVQK